MVIVHVLNKDHSIKEVHKLEAVFILPDGLVQGGEVIDTGGMSCTIKLRAPEGGMVVIT